MLRLLLVTWLAILSAVHAASIDVERVTEKRRIVPVLQFAQERNPDGFSFSFEGGDKSFREESAILQGAGTDAEALEVSGSYRYIDADEHEVEVHYTAGRHGFVPVGTNILPEISAAAKAAADLPNDDHDKESLHLRKRSLGAEEPVTKPNDSQQVEKEVKVSEGPKVQEARKTDVIKAFIR